MLELEAQLPRIRSAWMAGRSALENCPVQWRPTIGEGPSAETAIAALAGHAIQTLFRPVPPARLSPRPLLPRLRAPLVPPEIRSRLRCVMAAARANEEATRLRVQLVAARGYAIHPADWMPGPRDDWAPTFYAPWRAWTAKETPVDPTASLTSDSYDEWSWVEKRPALLELRRSAPDAARTIISAKATSEPAENRLKLVELLSHRLGPADTRVLEQFAEDRSERVQAAARRLLARLGHSNGDPMPARKLAGMLNLATVGLIKRRTRLELQPLKTQVEEKGRQELLSQVALPALADALGCKETALVESAPIGEPKSVAAFVGQVAQTGSDAACRTLLERIVEDAAVPIDLAIPLAPRLVGADSAVMLARLMQRDASSAFANSIAFAGNTLGAVPEEILVRSVGYDALIEMVRASSEGDAAARTRAEFTMRATLNNLGLLLTAAAARSLIDSCVALGLSGVDPRLDLLHLNAALLPEQNA